MTNYPIGDFLTRIKNAGLARRREVVMEKSKYIKAVAEALVKEGYLLDAKEEKNKLIVQLAYHKKEPVLMDLKIVSKPGLRVYMGIDELEKVRGSYTFLISTPDGIVSLKQAIRDRVGGEVIVKLW